MKKTTVTASELFEDIDQLSAKVVKVEETHTKRRRRRSYLIGKFLHTFNDKGEMEYQGEVMDVDGDYVICRMFDFFTGFNVQIKTLPKALVYSDACKLYEDRESWVSAAEDYERRCGSQE